MQGASALEAALEKVNGPVDVLSVWEPVLPTDLLGPGKGTLPLLRDARVWQMWDRAHLMSDAMREGMVAHPSDIPLERQRRKHSAGGVLWDAVAVFGPDAKWEQTLPAPAYLGGDVVDVAPTVKALLEKMLADRR